MTISSGHYHDKRNETKRNETKRNETKRNETKRNETIISSLHNALSPFSQCWADNAQTILNRPYLLAQSNQANPELMAAMLADDVLKNHFFAQAGEAFVFKTQDFRFFLEQNRLNNSYTRFANRIGLSVDDVSLKQSNDVVLDFPFKDCVLAGGQSSEEGTDTVFELKNGEIQQSSEKRQEIFFNQVLAFDEIDRLLDPKAFCNAKRITADGEAPATTLKRNSDGTISDNLIIKGNNLIALHTLATQFKGKIKLIYIDPPYNTGNDSFKYNDNFNHSTWLTFMKNRLEAAKALLSDDGSIWINLDDTEAHYCKVLCDEVFGRENFIANVIWEKKNVVQNDAKFFSTNHDHILVFSKNVEKFKLNLLPRTEEMNARYSNPDNDPRGDWTSVALQAKSGSENNIYEIIFDNGVTWKPVEGTFPRLSKESLEKAYKENRLWFGKNGKNVPRLKNI